MVVVDFSIEPYLHGNKRNAVQKSDNPDENLKRKDQIAAIIWQNITPTPASAVSESGMT